MYSFGIAYYIGFFLIMIVCSILAIVFAQRTAGWILWGSGAGFQGLVLLGKQMNYNNFGYNEVLSPDWTIYLFLAIGTAVIVYMRRNKF